MRLNKRKTDRREKERQQEKQNLFSNQPSKIKKKEKAE